MSLLPEVREELVATAARIAESPRRRVRFARPRGGIAMVLGVGVALAVVAVGLVALRHRAPAPASSGPPAGSGVAALEAKLAILRRPQTPGEAAYARRFSRRGAAVKKLTRIVTVEAGGTPVHIYVLVARLPRRPSPFVTATAVDRNGQPEGGSGPVTASTLTPAAVGSVADILRLSRDPNSGFAVGIVPDGVVRVKWVFTGAGFGILHPDPVTAFAEVRANIAVAPTHGPLASAVWYAADGRVIASAPAGRAAKQELRRIQAVNASRGRSIAPELIAHYRLFRSVAPMDLTKSSVLPTAAGGVGDLNYWQTRYIGSLTGLDGPGLWITPGTHDLCISDPNAGDCTAPLSSRDDAGISGGITGNGRETTFVGLVPDGNPSVTVVMANGARKTFPVIENAYEFTVRGRVVAMINRDIHGKVVRTSLGD
jgi:hypothetical protein